MKRTLNFDNNDDFDQLKNRVLRILSPIKSADKNTLADKNFLLSAQKTKAGEQLPPYYLVYFLLVNFLRFQDLGRFEKIAWSIPIDFNGRAFLIEHRKFGLGLFAHGAKKEDKDATEIVKKIRSAIKTASPYFEFVASQEAKDSKLNVRNNGKMLFERYKFFAQISLAMSKEDKNRIKKVKNEIPAFEGLETRLKSKKPEWMAISAIDAFFSWTEHIFIHLSILDGKVLTGEKVADLAKSDWHTKFKNALSLDCPEIKKLYNELTEIRRQLRNYIAHGAFGKNGEAFSFHSRVGAVPLLLPHQKGKPRFILSDNLSFDEHKVINTIEKFIKVLWKGKRGPAKLYIQESDLPLILTYAADGTYQNAMKSKKSMENFLDRLADEFDQAANMDF